MEKETTKKEQIDKITSANSKKNKRIYAINITVIVLIFAFVFFYVLKVDGIDNIKLILHKVDYKWVIVGLLCLIGMWLAESITLQAPLKKLYPDQTLKNSIKITMIGQLFNNLTPFASGGQIMQAYVLNKEGRRISDSLSVLTMKFLITQTTLIIFTILVVISQFKFFEQIFHNMLWIGVLGIVLNILVVVIFFLAATKKEWVMKIAKPIIRFIGKIHIGKFRLLKKVDEKIEKFELSVENFSNQFKGMKKHKKTLATMTIVGLIQSILYYAITYTVYRAFGNYGASFFEIITTQAFLMLIMTVFPTPGSGLGAEGGFLLLFNSIFKAGTIHLSILFWRIYVFYLPIIVGTIFFIPTRQNHNIKSEEKF